MNRDFETIAIPRQRTRSHTKTVNITLHTVAATLGHGPALLGAVQRDIDSHMIVRVALTSGKGAAVVGRENATNESDNRQAVVAAVGERVDVPPEICTRRERLVESR